MKPVQRDELLDLGAYEQIRDRFRQRVVEEKKARRLALGPNITVLFESHDTVLFQIQEMLRTERITKEAGILHELETYNELVPGNDELSITAFIEYPDREEREHMLTALAGIEDCFYVASGSARVAFRGATRGDNPERTTAVHYLKAELSPALREAIVAGAEPVVVGVDHASYRVVTELGSALVRSLADDLSE